jgi:hypothetical protein
MKKTQITLAALAVFAAATFTIADPSEKVKINHNGSVIEVAPQAVAAHLGHGDTVVGAQAPAAAAPAAPAAPAVPAPGK